jgi:TRAP-type mannitol/chloroaromatic compound transport system permease small subunit
MRHAVPFLLSLSRNIDRFSERVGQLMRWLILGSVLISAANALMRKAFGVSSNAYLEVQWYLFSAVFLLGAGYVFLKNAHVRIDFISNKLSARTNAWIDLVGMLLVVIPLGLMLIYLSWPLFQQAWASGEMSQNAGGLVRWPVLLLMPVGFGLLLLQAASELIKRGAFLAGHLEHPITPEGKTQDEGTSP